MGTYTGTFPKLTVEVKREDVIKSMKSWAKLIANDNRYVYKTWSSDTKTHQCPVCHPELMNQSYGKYPKGTDGWNCIGFSWAIWHHGGLLDCKCNCGVISNEASEKILKAKTIDEAINIVQTKSGLKDVTVIRNGGKKIPKSKAQPGDIALLFDGNTYKHTFFIMSDKYIADSTGSGTKENNIRANREFEGRYVNGLKVLIRWTGKSTTRKYLQSGDSGSEIVKLQKFLNWAIDAKLKEDGEFGSLTESAVKKFQKKIKVTQDGKWGSETQKFAKLFDKQITPTETKKEDPKPEPIKEKKAYTGKLPTLTLKKTNAEVIDGAVKWAVWIANDNSFHYGYTNKHGSKNSKDWSPNAHHNGCYFCGTNTDKGNRSKKGIVDYKKTYCCNPFVGAAWAHGGCVPAAMKLCSKGGSWSFSKGSGYDASPLFKKMGHPAKKKLKKGDVLCKSGHTALYIGNGKIAEAGGGDDNKKNSTKWNNSIRVRTLTTQNYKSFSRVYRFKSSVNTTAVIKHGEVSNRVYLWQQFLNWYFEGKVGKPDGYYGDNTFKWTKKFQEEAIGKGQGDGIIGEKTLLAAASVKK